MTPRRPEPTDIPPRLPYWKQWILRYIIGDIDVIVLYAGRLVPRRRYLRVQMGKPSWLGSGRNTVDVRPGEEVSYNEYMRAEKELAGKSAERERGSR